MSVDAQHEFPSSCFKYGVSGCSRAYDAREWNVTAVADPAVDECPGLPALLSLWMVINNDDFNIGLDFRVKQPESLHGKVHAIEVVITCHANCEFWFQSFTWYGLE